jgi:hypothetical protein
MNSKREFNSLKINITTRTTQFCWERIKRIIRKITLENLSIISCDPRREAHTPIVEILLKLPVNQLKELSLTNVNLDHFSSVFSRQKAITSLSVTGFIGDSAFISHFSLKHLKLVGPKTKQLASILRYQRQLKSLKLTLDEESDYNNEVLAEILQLSQLEALDVPFNQNVSPNIITSLRGLNFITKLNISCSQPCFQYLVMTPIPSLKELDITFDAPGSTSAIPFLAHNIPNLREIKLRGPLVANFLNDVTRCFKKLESLWIENDESYFVNILNLNSVESFNETLKHLFVINHDRKVVICSNDLIRYVKMFSKLETLVISKFIDLQLKNVEVLLRHLPALQEIIVDSRCIDSTTSVMKVLNMYGRNIKFVMLENFKQQCDTESLKVFFEGKFPVIEKKDGNLLLRRNEKMFLNKIMS